MGQKGGKKEWGEKKKQSLSPIFSPKAPQKLKGPKKKNFFVRKFGEIFFKGPQNTPPLESPPLFPLKNLKR